MPTLERFSHEALRNTVVTFRDTMKAHAPGINKLNVYPVPDGDTGTNMALTLQSVAEELSTAGTDLASVCRAISHGSLMGARGNSGVILSQILRGIADVVRDAGAHDGAHAGPGDGIEGSGAVDAAVVAQAMVAAADAAYSALGYNQAAQLDPIDALHQE